MARIGGEATAQAEGAPAGTRGHGGVELRARRAARGGERRRREKEEREGGRKRKEKRKKEKGKRKMEREREKERERELSVGFAAAVGHARAAAFGRSVTSTRNERKGEGIGHRLVLVPGRQIAGNFFGKKWISDRKGFGMI